MLSEVNKLVCHDIGFSRQNWLVEPVKWQNSNKFPEGYINPKAVSPDTQAGNECSGCASAYLLRFYGEPTDGVELFNSEDFPAKFGVGAFPKCFRILFEEQRKDYSTEYYTGSTDDLKDAVSKGIPVIVLLNYGRVLHYVPVVGYDKDGFYLQDSVEEFRNVDGNGFYNESLAADSFDDMWNIPLESCQRLFIVVRKGPESVSGPGKFVGR